MKLLNRHKWFMIIAFIAAVLWSCVLLFCPDPVMIGYSVRNGIEDHTYASKPEATVRLLLSTTFLAVIWELFARWIQGKIDSAPEMFSYKFLRGVIYGVCSIFLILICVIAITNLLN